MPSQLGERFGDRLCVTMEDATRHHVHILTTAEQEALHEFIDDCPCDPEIEATEDEDGVQVIYFFHNTVQ